MKKYFAIILVAGLLLSACSPANQPKSAAPSDVVEQTEQQPTDTIVENKTEVPKEENSTVTLEKKDPVETPTPEKEARLPEKLEIPSYTHLIIWGAPKSPIDLGTDFAKLFANEVLLKAEPIRPSEAASADYPLSCLLYQDGTYTEYLIDLAVKQLKFGEDQYRLNDSAVVTLSEMLAPTDMDQGSMTAVELNKLIFDKEDGFYIRVTATYPDRIFAVLTDDPTVSVEILTEDIPPTNETVVVASMKYWKSADGKQLFFDQTAEVETGEGWRSRFQKDGDK